MKKVLLFFAALAFAFNAMATEKTITETFENQTSGNTYTGQMTYTADNSNVGIGWYVEHGTVTTTAYLTGTKSMHMRAYYAKSSAASTWNGALPYVYTTTAIQGLKSVTFNAAASNTRMKYDTYYSTDGSTWTAIQTEQSLTTTTASYSFDIPNYSASTSYYIKIAASSSITHAASPSNAGNYTFRIDDVAFTYEDDAAAVDPTITATAGTAYAGDDFDLSTMFSSNSQGAFVYSVTAAPTDAVEDEDYYISGATFYSIVEGVFTIQASQAAAGNYNAGTQTATLTVNPEKQMTSVVISGTPDKTEYRAGDALNPAGLVVTINYDNNTSAQATSGITWAFDPATLAAGTTSCNVTATINGMTSAAYTVSGLTVAAPDVYVHDIFTASDFEATSTTYKNFSNVSATNGTGSKYAGNNSNNNGISIRTSNSNSGIVMTSSTGLVKKVTVEWNTNTVADRTLCVYAKNEPYAQATDLYDDDTKGTLVGTIVKGTSTELVIDGNYAYVGVRSNDAALFMNEIDFALVSLSSIAISGEATTKTYTAGDVFNPAGLVVTATYADNSELDVTTAAQWAFDPAVLIASTTSVDAVASFGNKLSNAFTVSGITVAAANTPTSLTITGTPAEFWLNDTFNHNGITVTAAWTTGDPTDVTADCTFSTPDMTTAGEKTVTVSFSAAGANVENTYTIEVKTIGNTAATAYTTAQASALIDAGKDLTTAVYVTGVVSQVAKFNDTYKSITYWLDENSFEIYGGLRSTENPFTSINDIEVGATVVVYGVIKDYTDKNGAHVAYEMDKNSVLISYEAPDYHFYMIGSEDLFGAEGTIMTDNENGTYSLTVSKQLAAGEYSYNVEARPVIEQSQADAVAVRRVAPSTPADAKSFTLAQAGTYNLQFDYNAETGVLTSTNLTNGFPTALGNTEAQKVEKIFRNGQVVIIKNGVEYNAIGQKL